MVFRLVEIGRYFGPLKYKSTITGLESQRRGKNAFSIYDIPTALVSVSSVKYK